MGYTHYFTRRKNVQINKEDWNNLRRDIALIYHSLPKDIQIENKYNKPGITATAKEIWFNGAPPDDFETFVLEKEPQPNEWQDDKENIFSFCKTGHRPYDTFVVATLLATKSCLGAAYKIGSDGSPREWEEGMKLATKALGRDMPIMLIEAFEEGTAEFEEAKELHEQYNIYEKALKSKEKFEKSIDSDKKRKSKQNVMKM